MEAFNAGRDININHSKINFQQEESQFKPWDQCSIEELLQGQSLHSDLRQEEIDRQSKFATPFFITGIVCCIITLIISMYLEQMVHPLIAGFTALGAFGGLAGGAKLSAEKSLFQQRQENTLQIIASLLRERGYRKDQG